MSNNMLVAEIRKYSIVFPKQVIVGAGTISQMPDILSSLRHVPLIIFSKSIYSSETGKKIKGMLKDFNLIIAEPVTGEPDVEMINRIYQSVKDRNISAIIAIGGGSTLDLAKCVGLLKTNGGSIEEYQLYGRNPTIPPIPIIAVPTTAGTGSEASKVAVITNKKERIKKSIAFPSLIPEIAILDAELTTSLPPDITALTGIDALSHALEAYCSRGANAFTDIYSEKAIRLIIENLPRVFHNGKDLAARENMLVASYLAGLSLNAGVGMAHIFAQPLGAKFGFRHAEAIARILIPVVESNYNYISSKLMQLDKISNMPFLERIKALFKELQIDVSFKKIGAKADDFDELYEIITKSTLHIKTNPRPVDRELLREVYLNALNGE